ncbi:hypothetical protein [Streptomyces sp. 8N706]|uniref:hypothetical protein n=1 Tax=Streptomyces sp. 8N706 TaxID=3457416 RepID=UPI003FD0AD9D
MNESSAPGRTVRGASLDSGPGAGSGFSSGGRGGDSRGGDASGGGTRGTGGEARPTTGIAAGAVTAVVGALLLGTLQGALGPQGHELGYWALGIGLLVGAVLGKAGGRSRAVAVSGIPLAMAGVAIAQLLAAAMQSGSAGPGYSPLDLLTGHAGPALDYWRSEILGKNDVTFYTVAALEGFLVAKRVAE